MDKLNLGIIGMGHIIKSHLQAIKFIEDYKITHICDIEESKLNKYKKELKCEGFTDYKDLLKEDVDVVLIALPHVLHCPVTIDALKAGCHVMVEKPMAISVKQCNMMLETASQHQKQIIVTDLASFYPGVLRTGTKFREGKLGKFLTGSIINQRNYFHKNRPQWFLEPETSGGGMFANVGLHRLAVSRSCLPGLNPVSVNGEVRYLEEYNVEACTTAMVKYEEGGSVLYEEVGYFPVPEWLSKGTHFIFEKGIVAWDDNYWYMIDKDGNQYHEKLPQVENHYIKVYQNMLSALRGEDYFPRAYEYAMDVAIAQGAYASSEQNKEINLSDPEWKIKKPEEVTMKKAISN